MSPKFLALTGCGILAVLWLMGLVYFTPHTSPQIIIPCQTIFNPTHFDGDVAAEGFLRKAIPVGAKFDCVRAVMSHPRMLPAKPLSFELYHGRVYSEKLGPWYEYPLRLGLNTRIVQVNFNSNGTVESVKVN